MKQGGPASHVRLHCQLPANVMVKLYYSFVYSHLRRVTFACLRLCKGPYMWACRNTLTCTPMSCKARKLTRFNLVSWKLSCALIGSFVYDDPRRQEHKQDTAIGRTWLVRLTICTIITSQILSALAIDIMWFLKKSKHPNGKILLYLA